MLHLDSIVLCLAKGVKQKRLLGGNPTNLSFFISVLCFPHFHNSVMIVFFVFLFAFVPSKTVMISLEDDRLVMLEKTETFCSRKEFSFLLCKSF